MDERYGPATYGDHSADIYDDLYGLLSETDPTVEFLWQLGRGGRALELGIGTGRIALPLRQMGIDVTGIDASEKMVERLRAKPGGGEIRVTIADFSDFDLGERFDLVFVVFNTLFNLTTQDDQLACFRAAERHLNDDGLFVVEAFVPDVTMFDRHGRLAVERVETDRVVLHVMRHSPVEQLIDVGYVALSEAGTKLYPLRSRYAYPAELDLMAKLARLRLRDRWGGWGKEPFASDSPRHVSVYERE